MNILQARLAPGAARARFLALESLQTRHQRLQRVTQRRTFASGRTENALLSWPALTALGVAAVGLVAFFQYQQDQHRRAKEAQVNRGTGRPLVGGPFSLVDDTGRPVSDLDYLGKWLLIYFGYTFCPDVCPDELDKMAAVVQALAARPGVPPLVPVFVSCDPKRDSVQVIHDYIKEFDPSFVGLTGTYQQIKRAAKAYRLYFSSPPKALDDDERDYLVDHSIFCYLVNPSGEFVAHFGKPDSAGAITSAVSDEMAKYELSHRR